MGIRFHCPTCSHKLNVKAFLAGKRGVCPQCGAGLDIPLESQVRKEASEKKRAAKPPGRDKSESVEAEDLLAVPVSAPARVDDVPVAAASGPRITVPTSSAPQAATAATSPVISIATSAAPSAPARRTVPVQPITPVQPVAPVATPVPAAPVDHIEEAPDSSWYVRPPSGGQYGPARGNIMRKWITEGRVSADSLVWREGWDDWIAANEAFPSLGSVATPPVPAPAPVSYNPSPPATTESTSSYRPRRRNTSTLAITTVVVLGLMSVALLVTLIIVMNS